MAELPSTIIETGSDDINSVDTDIDSLYKKFITPIEMIRSISEAPVGTITPANKDDFLQDLKINKDRPFESRASAFYRMLGFPVIDKSNNFYNPGFDPSADEEENDERLSFKDSVNENIDGTVLNKLENRDSNARLLRDVFIRQDWAATFFAYLMRHPKPFNTITSESYTVDDRSKEIFKLQEEYPAFKDFIQQALDFFKNYPAGSPNLDGGKHYLSPMYVNPAVAITVMPATSLVCVPFLKDKSKTKYSSSPDVFLQRPGIEFIIRSRLKDQTQDQEYLKNVKRFLDKSNTGSNNEVVQNSSLKSEIQAIAGNLNISTAEIESSFSFSNVESFMIKQLLNTMKFLISELFYSVSELDKIVSRIDFYPLPSTFGPEQKGTVREASITSLLEGTLIRLKIKKLNSERDKNISQELGNFATPFSDLERTVDYEEEIQRLSQLKKEFGEEGLDHLKKIEIITGEISGLGLIDILAIYMTLWSIDIKVLLALLDSSSFSRLYVDNRDLITQDVQDIVNNMNQKMSVSTAIEEIEAKVGIILSFADTLYKLEGQTPLIDRGDPA